MTWCSTSPPNYSTADQVRSRSKCLFLQSSAYLPASPPSLTHFFAISVIINFCRFPFHTTFFLFLTECLLRLPLLLSPLLSFLTFTSTFTSTFCHNSGDGWQSLRQHLHPLQAHYRMGLQLDLNMPITNESIDLRRAPNSATRCDRRVSSKLLLSQFTVLSLHASSPTPRASSLALYIRFILLLRHAPEPVPSLHSLPAFLSPPTLSFSIHSDRTPTLRHAISCVLHYTKYSTTRCSTVRHSTYSGHTVDRAGQAKAGTVVQSHINALIPLFSEDAFVLKCMHDTFLVSTRHNSI